MRLSSGIRFVLALAVLLPWPSEARGAEVVHKLRQGETLWRVATNYWGRGDLADLLRTHNRLSRGPIRTGTSLRVPLHSEVIVSRGGSWDVVAAAELGDEGLGRLLAAMNGRSPGDPPKAGERIVIPGLAIHTLERGETLAAVARRFLSDGAMWPMIARLNGIRNPNHLTAGTRIKVPFVGSKRPPERAVARTAPELPAVSVAAPTAAAEDRSLKPHTAAPDLPAEKPQPTRDLTAPGTGLESAIQAFRDGRYEVAREGLESVRSAVLSGGSAQEQVDLLEHLTFVHVAFGNTDAACEAYRELRVRDPDHLWDELRISPKISRTTALCQTQ